MEGSHSSEGESFLTLSREDVPTELLQRFIDATETGQWAKIASKQIRSRLLYTVTARSVRIIPTIRDPKTKHQEEKRWVSAPTKEEAALLLEIDPACVDQVLLAEDGNKLRISLNRTIAPTFTHRKEETWDLRVFPTVLNGFNNLAFIQTIRKIQDDDHQVAKFLTTKWFEGQEQIAITDGSMWRPTKNGNQNVQGKWIVSNEPLRPTPAARVIYYEDKALARIHTPWEDPSKPKKRPNNNEQNTPIRTLAPKRKSRTDTPPNADTTPSTSNMAPAAKRACHAQAEAVTDPTTSQPENTQEPTQAHSELRSRAEELLNSMHPTTLTFTEKVDHPQSTDKGATMNIDNHPKASAPQQASTPKNPGFKNQYNPITRTFTPNTPKHRVSKEPQNEEATTTPQLD